MPKSVPTSPLEEWYPDPSMTTWIVAAAILALATTFLVSRIRRYGRLFSDAHFLEIARAAATLQSAAHDRMIHKPGDEPTSRDDPRALQTSAGLVIVYTVRRDEASFIHHLSLSQSGGYTAHAVGATVLAFVATRLGLPIERMTFGVGASTVHHGEAVLAPSAHERLRQQRLADVTEDAIRQLRSAAHEAGRSVPWQRAMPLRR